MPPTTTLTPSSPQPVALRRRAAIDPIELDRLNASFEHAEPADIVGWAVARFRGRLAMTASFADTTLIDVATGVDPDVSVVFLDTGFHFAETLATVKRAMERYQLDLTVLRADVDAPDVWGSGADACCNARKTELLDRHLTAHVDAWMSGLRRADSPERSDVPILSIDRRGLVKINPLATMDDDAHAAYVAEHDVIVNPLQFDGYASIGCWPCTEPSTDGRAGRWAGAAKTECGLHL